MRQVVLDTETTGLEAERGHKIIEIGAVEVIDRRLSGRRFHRYLNPERDIDDAAMEVHGLTQEFLADKPKFAEIAEELLDFIRGAELVIHNAGFDLSFLDRELAAIDPLPGSIRDFCEVTDSLALARHKHPGQKNSLDALCRRYAVDNSQRELMAGLQQSGSGAAPRKVAMVFIDAHGDFNTPESTLSGMLGGMPVAVSAGMCLTNLRREAGLDPPLPTSFILLGAARDLDPLERELLDESDIVQFSTEDIRETSDQLHAQMQRLSQIADLIYIHVDMDVLDPAEVPGHPLTVPGGPTSLELGAALEAMFEYPKAAALGIASTPWGPRDPDGLSLRAAYNLIEGALRGVQARER